MRVTTARLMMAVDPSKGFAKFASGLMRCNQQAFTRVADDIVSRSLPAGGRVLDLGASAGEPSLTIASKCTDLHVISTDYAPPNLELGKVIPTLLP